MIILLLLFGLLCYDFFVFPHFLAGSLVVRESRHRRDRIFDKNSQKRRFFGGGSEIFFSKVMLMLNADGLQNENRFDHDDDTNIYISVISLGEVRALPANCTLRHANRGRCVCVL
tara:strand:+ start:77 stop:421 length:345 start_codon:yes stop_codon:yes gene_type:complete